MDDRTSPLEDALPDDDLFVVLFDDPVVEPVAPLEEEVPVQPLPDSGQETLELIPAVDEEELLRDAEEDIDEELARQLSFEDALRRLSLPRLGRFAAILVAAALPLLFAVGWPYYSLSLAHRPLHDFHQVLRSSGSLGLSLGLAGTFLIVVSMTYVVCKPFLGQAKYALQRRWLGLHIVTGLLGPALVLFHTGFLPTSALGGLAAVAMVIAVFSGLAGRYVLAYVPFSEDGDDLGRESLRHRLSVYRRKLEELHVDQELLVPMEAPVAEKRRPWLITALVRAVIGDRESREEYRTLKQAARTVAFSRNEARLVLILARRLCRERQMLVRYQELRKIIGTWRFLHRWLAIVLILGTVLHVMVAVRYGDLWVLGGGR